jgi:hypothetical protein
MKQKSLKIGLFLVLACVSFGGDTLAAANYYIRKDRPVQTAPKPNRTVPAPSVPAPEAMPLMPFQQPCSKKDEKAIVDFYEMTLSESKKDNQLKKMRAWMSDPVKFKALMDMYARCPDFTKNYHAERNSQIKP